MKIGPIPTIDGIGKEVITRMTTNMTTDKVFYTDSNGRDFIKRVQDILERNMHEIFISMLRGVLNSESYVNAA